MKMLTPLAITALCFSLCAVSASANTAAKAVQLVEAQLKSYANRGYPIPANEVLKLIDAAKEQGATRLWPRTQGVDGPMEAWVDFVQANGAPFFSASVHPKPNVGGSFVMVSVRLEREIQAFGTASRDFKISFVDWADRNQATLSVELPGMAVVERPWLKGMERLYTFDLHMSEAAFSWSNYKIVPTGVASLLD